MSDPMCFAELGELHVELLPARTVLSLWAVSTGGNGDPGTAGANGQGGSKFSFFGIFGYGGSDSTYTFGGSTYSSRG
ncbi:MAG TPA: hypothetical protein VJT72_18700 [Pseudonocardiaceae bacterium]|nr:hypothetical protein [Pseudonocardiaceae bacterium]